MLVVACARPAPLAQASWKQKPSGGRYLKNSTLTPVSVDGHLPQVTGKFDSDPCFSGQYTGARYRAKAEAASIQLSMSRAAMPYDNALAESFFATLKLEIGDDKPFESQHTDRSAVFEYVELFYNRVRLHSALGYRSPTQAERDYQKVRSVS